MSALRSMHTQLVINSLFGETRIAVLEKSRLSELFIERKSGSSMSGSIYKGKVEKIVPGVQAAFVDIGTAKSGFLSAEDVYEESPSELFLEDGEGAGNSRKNRQPIQEALREGQEVMVQAVKEPTGTKGPKLTCRVGIPGKYLVLLPAADGVSVSRKITDAGQRKRLSGIMEKRPRNMGVILRTACAGAEEGEIRAEMKSLAAKWRRIRKKYESSRSPRRLYEESSVSVRVVRDVMGNGLKKIVVDSPRTHAEISKYFSDGIEKGNFRVDLYGKSEPIFERYGIESQIEKMYRRQVWMKSGGYLIIDEAEGLTVVDVNSGRFVGEEAHEQTILKTNREAAVETARQIRLRNLVGIIVIDFIDMRSQKSRRKIESLFFEEMAKDKARSTIQKMSSFGVVQLTRRRVRESVLSDLTEPCGACGGGGRVKSVLTLCYEILRDIDRRAGAGGAAELAVRADGEVIDALRKTEGKALRKIQRERSVRIRFEETEDSPDGFSVTEERVS